MTAPTALADKYNQMYSRPNCFGYYDWIYEPYITSLVRFCGLKEGDSLLDVGCGQGFFSYLFGKSGLKVHGIDVSERGIEAARDLYGHLGLSFSVAAVEVADLPEQFDCIFVRSCSSYNTENFARQTDVTEMLLRHLKPGGRFIFAYNSNFSSRKNSAWRYHSLEDVRSHFRPYPGARMFFLNRLTACVLRRYSFNRLVTGWDMVLSKVSGKGGDLICTFRKD